VIEVRNISKTFPGIRGKRVSAGITAIQSVSLTVNDGRIVSLLGPSGCGKSTLIEIIAGLQAPTEGCVFIDGTPVLEAVPSDRKGLKDYRKKYRFMSLQSNGFFRNRRKHDVAVVFQDHGAFPWMTVLKNVMFVLYLHGISRGERSGIAIEILRKFRLADFIHLYPSQLSGGMKQRLALACAISSNPKVILLDEPFASVDDITREGLQDILLEIRESAGITIVLVTHDIDEAVYLSDEVVIFTGQPGKVHSTVSVDLSRPRKRKSPELVSFYEIISGTVKAGNQKSLIK